MQARKRRQHPYHQDGTTENATVEPPAILAGVRRLLVFSGAATPCTSPLTRGV